MRRNEEYAAPDLESDEPERTGPARFWEIIQSEFASLLKLNLIFLLSCIPVVTIPPALLALHQVLREMVLDRSGRCAHRYWAAFKNGWKQAYGAFFMTALPLALAGYGAAFYLRYAPDHLILLLPFALCAAVFLTAALASTYLYGLLSSGWSLGRAARTALLLGIAKPLRAVLAAGCCYGLPLLAVLFFPLSGIYLLLIGISLPCLLGHFYLRTVLAQCCAPAA